MAFLQNIRDGLTSLLTGAGTSVDRRQSAFYNLVRLDPVQIETRYRSSWLARKIVDIPPYDMTREGRDWQAEADQIELLEAEEKRLDLWGKLRRALILGRLGGGALVIGAGTEDAALPLNLRTLSTGGIRYLHVFSRYQLSLGQIVTDPQNELVGQPAYFQISGGGTLARIHPSRVIPFKGLLVPQLSASANTEEAFWGDSVLQAVDDAIKNADLAQNGFASLIDEAKIDVYGIPEFLSSLGSAEYEARFRTRMDLMNVSKSTHRAVFKDAGETWETRQISWAGMPEIVRTYLGIVAGAADIPATRLLGKAPDGMNATGEGDEKNYLQSVKARQQSDLGPALERLDEVLIRSALGSRPDEVHYSFAPLFMLDEKEQASIAKTKAETIKIYADTGTVPIDALSTAAQNMLIEDGTLPGLEAALEEVANEPEKDPNEQDPSELQAEEGRDGRRLAANDSKRGGPNASAPFADYSPDQPRGPDGRWIATGASISSHVRRATSSQEHSTTSLGEVSRENAEAVMRHTGVSIARHERILQSNEIRHVMKSHGDPVREQSRGQVAIGKADFPRIPEITKRAHEIRLIGVRGARKPQRLEYVANIGRHQYRYVEEIRPANRIVALKAMRKKLK